MFLDLGSLTLLFRQPVAALQIQDHAANEWKWVKPQDGTVTVNACDALSFLTAGYVKSTIHCVTVPPKDQQHVDRLGLLYFARSVLITRMIGVVLLVSELRDLCSPESDVRLATIRESPLLQREGCLENAFEKSGNSVPTMGGTSAHRALPP